MKTCPECGGNNDLGYVDGGDSPVIHFESCSLAPTGKRKKMEGVRVSVDSLPKCQHGVSIIQSCPECDSK
jgi:hypothetical protein